MNTKRFRKYGLLLVSVFLTQSSYASNGIINTQAEAAALLNDALAHASLEYDKFGINIANIVPSKPKVQDQIEPTEAIRILGGGIGTLLRYIIL